MAAGDNAFRGRLRATGEVVETMIPRRLDRLLSPRIAAPAPAS